MTLARVETASSIWALHFDTLELGPTNGGQLKTQTIAPGELPIVSAPTSAPMLQFHNIPLGVSDVHERKSPSPSDFSDRQLAPDDPKALVRVVVMVPVESPLELSHLDVLAVEVADDARRASAR